MSTGGAPIGNQNARKAKLWENALKRAIARKAAGDLNNGLDKLADKLVTAAEIGEQWALMEVGNRLDGKPAQAIIGGGEDDPPLKLVTRVELVAMHGNGTDSAAP